MSRKRHEEQARDKGPTPVSRKMQQRIFDQEEVVMVARPGRLATLPKFVLTLGLYSFWRRRDTSVLTDQRILLGTGIVRRRERSIPLAVIADVTFARSGINSYADVTFQRRSIEHAAADRPDDASHRAPLRPGDPSTALSRQIRLAPIGAAAPGEPHEGAGGKHGAAGCDARARQRQGEQSASDDSGGGERTGPASLRAWQRPR